MPLAGLLLFVLLLPLVSIWFRIISTYVSRVHEFEADSTPRATAMPTTWPAPW